MASLTKKESFLLNEEQRQAYDSTGNCAVLAGPGSGKTKTLTLKIARMLAEDVHPPQRIACITYSNTCVRELRQRLSQLGVEDGPRAVLGTVHAFCLRHVVLPYAELAGLPVQTPIQVASAETADDIFEKALKSAISADENPKQWRLRCNRYRRTHVDRDAPAWLSDDEEAARVITAYEKRLCSDGLIDFDGIVLTALTLVREHAWIRRALKARFPVVVVDEYQDLGRPLHEIVTQLCFEGQVRLFVVGDPDQSIYGFNGAEPELLTELAGRDDVESVRLRLNYRCGSRIIRASEAALGEPRGYEAHGDGEGRIEFHEWPGGVEEQAKGICEQIIEPALQAGVPSGEIAVLYRTKDEGEVIVSAVQAKGWDYTRIDNGNAFLRRPLALWLQDCAAWCGGGCQRGEPRLSTITRAWANFNPSEPSEVRRRSLQEDLVKFLYENRNAGTSLHDWLMAFRDRCLQRSFDAEPTLEEEAAAVQTLVEATAEGEELEGLTVGTYGGQGGNADRLHLMTLHAAKGLEFDLVVMMGLEQGRLPAYGAIKSRDEQNPEPVRRERRLFYVGLTRARHDVHLAYSGWFPTRRGSRCDLGRSEFVDEVAAAVRAN